MPEDSGHITICLNVSDPDLNDNTSVFILDTSRNGNSVWQFNETAANNIGSIIAQPANRVMGVAIVDAQRRIRYSPKKDWFGTDILTVFAMDAQNAFSIIQAIRIKVEAVNDAPFVALLTEWTVLEDSPYSQNLKADDIDTPWENLAVTITSLPKFGNLFFPNATPIIQITPRNIPFTIPRPYKRVQYVPPPNISSVRVTFDYFVDDGYLQSTVKTQSILISPVNDPPASGNSTVSTTERDSVQVTLTCTDIDSAITDITFKITRLPENNTIQLYQYVDFFSNDGSEPLTINLTTVITDSRIWIKPADGFFGTVSFDFQCADLEYNSSISTVVVNVDSINKAPRIDCPPYIQLPDSLTTGIFDYANISLTAFDPNNDAITYIIVDAPKRGLLHDNQLRPISNGDTLTFNKLYFSDNDMGGR
ncbi:hypothetical protein BKA69DRAFT_1041155 [Paraphysoderma sedebokerense]|nr:hypothetical protein BKA69DRAFT_1041155 [Paraphysoderma sedebokerense]